MGRDERGTSACSKSMVIFICLVSGESRERFFERVRRSFSGPAALLGYNARRVKWMATGTCWKSSIALISSAYCVYSQQASRICGPTRSCHVNIRIVDGPPCTYGPLTTGCDVPSTIPSRIKQGGCRVFDASFSCNAQKLKIS